MQVFITRRKAKTLCKFLNPLESGDIVQVFFNPSESEDTVLLDPLESGESGDSVQMS